MHGTANAPALGSVAASAPPAATISAAQRAAVVLLALAVLIWRMPSVFTHPQFWAEDIYFFYGARFDGWSSIFTPLAGYLCTTQYVVALLLNAFDPIVAPALYCYSAIALTLLVVWMVTSPRLEMPFKPILAIAVVVVPMGLEELGALCNIQWILPIGAFAILFMRAPKSKFVLSAELLYATLAATSGPFSIFLAPLFAWRAMVTSDPAERPRLIALTAIMAAAGITQALLILSHPIDIPAEPYPWTLWITLPLRKVMTSFGIASRYLEGTAGVVIGATLFAVAAIFSYVRPYRTQKICMIIFSLSIMLAGMYKARSALGEQLGAQRHYYVGSVLVLWFVCCLSDRRPIRYFLAFGISVAELAAFFSVRDNTRFTVDLEWSKWAGQISSGRPVTIPTNPVGWYLELPAATSPPGQN
jgi:hypothetical protein